MKLTITTLDDRIVNIEVADDLELENLKAQCEFELSIPSSTMAFTWNGRPLHDNKKTLRDYGVQDGDMLLLQQLHPTTRPPPQATGSGGAGAGVIPQLDFSSIQVPGRSQPARPDLEDPKVILELIKNNPHERALLKERNPPLSEALESGNVDRFVLVYTRQREERLKKETERNRILTMDPFDPEAQKLIAEEIRLKNVESNMESAIEFVPESFGQVVMLYIDCKVNGHPVKAFVDSGAQMTIMSQACAERCNIMRLVDTRWAGIAKGVGTQRIIGRVHLGMIQIGNDCLQSSFSILENQPMDMLLGLDMLKRHQCVIDLANNELYIGTTNTKTKFLPENQLPSHARINQEGDSTMDTSEDSQLAKALQKSEEEAAGSSNTNAARQRSSQASAPKPSGQPKSVASSNSLPQPSIASLRSGPNQSQGAAASGTAAQSTFPVDKIQKLVKLGYSQPDVIAALTEANGDEKKAQMILFAKSLKM